MLTSFWISSSGMLEGGEVMPQASFTEWAFHLSCLTGLKGDPSQQAQGPCVHIGYTHLHSSGSSDSVQDGWSQTQS